MTQPRMPWLIRLPFPGGGAEQNSSWWVYLLQPISVLVLAGLTALLGGLFVAPQGYIICAAISTVIAIGCAWPWIGLRGLDCQLRFIGTRTEEGKPVEIEISITNRWPFPAWGLAIEGGFHLLSEEQHSGSESPVIAVSRIDGWSRTRHRWQFVPEVRGEYPLANPRLITGFPFGLWKAEKPVKVLSRMIVWPRRFRLPPLLLPGGTQSCAGQPSEGTTGRFGQRTAVREYRPGDSMRQIHWAKTAFYDKLVSWEREGYANTEALVSLDTHPSLHRGTGPNSSIEWAVRIAASICETLLKQQISVNVVSDAGSYRAKMHGNQTIAMLDWLATLGTDKTHGVAKTGKAKARSRSAGLTIHVTTIHSSGISTDSVVLVTGPDGKATRYENSNTRSWMTIAAEGNIESQVRAGWQRGLGSSRHAV